jgi:hypothetical protein
MKGREREKARKHTGEISGSLRGEYEDYCIIGTIRPIILKNTIACEGWSALWLISRCYGGMQ